MDGWINGWMDEWMAGWLDGRIDSSSQQVSARGHYLARYITTVKNRERTDHDGSGRSRRIAAMKECINDFGD